MTEQWVKDAQETERKLFAGLSKVRTFPVDPNDPGMPPGRMIPLPVPQKDD
jgi:hypothetical protein